MTTRSRLHELARSIVEDLYEAGFTSYFAGGYVRDLLLDIPNDEIDIATSATPEEVMGLFPKTISVGAHFGVVIVVLEGHNFEVASFRSDGGYIDGRRPTHVHFSSAELDAARRDFTINGMFYDPRTHHILDYVGGQEDLKKRVVRAIGNPKERFAEDRLRMIRAVRFAIRLQFRIDEETRQAIEERASTLFPSVSMERIWQELTKMMSGPNPDQAIVMLHRLQLLQTIFPDLASVPLETIEERVEPFSRYPQKTPPIFYLHAVVPEMGLDLAPYLKTSNRDVKLLDLYGEYPSSEDRVEWCYYYAERDVWLCLGVMAASREAGFLEGHRSHAAALQKHIDRIVNRAPLVTSVHLKGRGVKPGPEMGELLREAERIAIEGDLDSAEEVLKKLNLSI